MSRSAIRNLWFDCRHGDKKHQEWLRNKIATWAEDEFNITFIYNELTLTDDEPKPRKKPIQNNT